MRLYNALITLTMSKFYQHSLPQPFHISVGAVLFNDNFEICVHHFTLERVPETLRFLVDNLPDVWHLMRESLEDGETLSEAVLRGCQEEFGATGTIEKFLGAKIDTIVSPAKEFQKCTLYHAVRLITLGERTGTDAEETALMEWYSPAALLELFNEQCRQTARPELDERVIIERFIEAYSIV